jgi:hypothetical protein
MKRIELMGITPEKRAEEARLAATQAETARHNRAAEAVSQGQLKVAQSRLGLDQQLYNVGAAPDSAVGLGEAALHGVHPQEANLIKKIANYEIALPVGIATSREPWVTRLRLAAAYDPTFDQSQYTARQRLRIAFQSSGKPADNIRSLNTAIGHLASLRDKSVALQNAPITLWNRIKNYGLSQTGDKRVAEFNQAATAVADELATLFKGTAGTDEQIEAWRDTLDSSMSPEQLEGVIDTAIELTSSRLEALTEQYRVGMGKPKDFRILYPKSREILRSMGANPDKLDPVAPKGSPVIAPPPAAGATEPATAPNPYRRQATAPPAQGGATAQPKAGGAVIVTAPNGKTYTFPNQEAADAFKWAAGIK